MQPAVSARFALLAPRAGHAAGGEGGTCICHLFPDPCQTLRKIPLLTASGMLRSPSTMLSLEMRRLELVARLAFVRTIN